MWDPLTVINAVECNELIKLTERGTAVLDDDGKVIFTASSTGNIRFQVPGDAAWCSAMLEKIRNVNKTH
jgi:leucyl aminopeptidase (aminopeptidase T)